MVESDIYSDANILLTERQRTHISCRNCQLRGVFRTKTNHAHRTPWMVDTHFSLHDRLVDSLPVLHLRHLDAGKGANPLRAQLRPHFQTLPPQSREAC